ncbi:putative 2-aminoethylphosphonate ABC transporter ATP-binding protein [Neptunomonas concharum]|uniref:Putative 2-aminoethylphosphonate ABC transporter ATP-binding protein n=1 Tax=Neptunomonas concharum TaxID=1031538 RepID=A0A5P1RAJ4_9GAMM|nr:putative 2-aminoethylphosphonate ABC transporter ATP-binding protein [Neptunomonas concharum]QEQ96623.1 putative 2-aminoethylphosphonate ABC transporter ATP-binding protein [Neptunomonas concharum]
MNQYLTIRNLSKSFGDFTALNNISLDIEEGDFVCFLGPSGCGKTTLLRAIAGLDMQTEGEIIQGLKKISWLPPEKRDFGIVFQSYALFPNLTVADNIAYGLKNRRANRQSIDQRVDELLQLIGLPDSGKKYPSQLSGGQQQRIALARAIATKPGLLLLDEPLSALDARVRLHLRREIKELQRKLGVTTIMVTHDQEEALSMADKIVVMNHGVIEQIGTPEEIYSTPASAFVAAFVGTMNFLDSYVSDNGKVQVGETYLQCDASLPDQASRAVTLAIRPEDIRVRFNGDATNVLQATVNDLEFLGSFARTELNVDGILEPVIADFSMNDIRDHNILPGAQVQLDLPKHRLHLFEGAR